MPAACPALNPPDHRGFAYDVSEVDIIRCVVKSEGRKEVRVQAFFVLKKDPNVKGRKQKSFSISKFGLEGAWSRANRCKDFIEQLGRFPVDENEIEAFQGKAFESTPFQARQGVTDEKENRSPSDEWSPYVHSAKNRRLSKDGYNTGSATSGQSPTDLQSGKSATSWRDVTARGYRRSTNKLSLGNSAAATEISKLGAGPLPLGPAAGVQATTAYPANAYFPCPPPHVPSVLTTATSLPSHFSLPNVPLQTNSSCTGLSGNRSRLLEQLSNSQFRHLLKFLDPASLAVVELTSQLLCRRIEEAEGWKLAFFNCLPHMRDLALSAAAPSFTPFPFRTASALGYKAFFAYECGVRHWVLLRDIRHGRGLRQRAATTPICGMRSSTGVTIHTAGTPLQVPQRTDLLALDEQLCINTLRKCLQCLTSIIRTEEESLHQNNASESGGATSEWLAAKHDEIWALKLFHQRVRGLLVD
eukprot:Blabericola_migrator_1__2144@NODE_1592_length_4213_cov_128_704534_g1040_i0_p2_GENE_NODE_1592_length_4213_cov_128_704534_g1040_i0NODE_1592_length_4213_cov_128_704534_g1040_i0_p2_ORF_typecomplete_len471_score37_91_NODE_1592_length_4213_cov_128_704534_g1040_i027224134